MKSVVSLTLIAALVGSAMPAAAQDRLESASGPIARAARREAARLAAVGEASPAKPDSAARSFTELRLLVTTGNDVIVTDSSGSQINGKVVALSDTSMTLAIQGTRRDVPKIACD